MPNWSPTYGAQGNVQLAFHPQNVYQPYQTAHAVNQQTADYTPDPNFMQKRFDGHGQSRSAGTLAAAMPQMSQQLTSGLLAGASQPLQDYTANQQNMQQGEINQSATANRAGGLLNALQGTNNQFALGTGANQLNQQAAFLSLLQQLMG